MDILRKISDCIVNMDEDNIENLIKVSMDTEGISINDIFLKYIDVSNQKIILDVFKEENNIISISKYYQLNPIKTVAVIFGIGNVEDKKDMCDRCNNKCFI